MADAPVVTGMSTTYIDNMAGGEQVVLTGTGFTGATAVNVDERSVPTMSVDSDTQITFTVPSFTDFTASSKFFVTVTTDGGTSERTGDATIQYGTAPADPTPSGPTGDPPTVTGLSHDYTDRMDGFYQVQVTGTGFTGATAVHVDERAASAMNVDSDTQISFTLPDFTDFTASSKFFVTVTTNNGTSERTGDATIQYGTVPP